MLVFLTAVFVSSWVFLLFVVRTRRVDCRASASDPCQTLPAPLTTPTSLPALMTCLHSSRFLGAHPSVLASTISLIRDTILPNYVYSDLNSSVIDKIQESLVLDATVLALSDFDILSRIKEAFLGLYDPHTVYVLPKCFSSPVLALPFKLRVVDFFDVTTNQTSVVLQLDKNDDVATIGGKNAFAYPPDLEDLLPLQVALIDSKNPWSHLSSSSSSECFYGRNQGARFNRLIGSEFHMRSFARNNPPENPSIKFTVISPNGTGLILDAPFYVFPTVDYRFQKLSILCGFEKEQPMVGNRRMANDNDEPKMTFVEKVMSWPGWFLRKHILQPHVVAGMNLYVSEKLRLRRIVRESPIRRAIADEKRRKGIPSDFDLVKLQFDDFGYFELLLSKDNNSSVRVKTAVLVVKTFMPDIDLSNLQELTDATKILKPFEYYVRELHSAFLYMKLAGTKRIIVDVRDNPGGVMCLATALLARMLSPYAPKDAATQGDYVVTDMGKKQHCSWNLADWITLFSQAREPVEGDWYTSGKERTRGGKTTEYSSLVSVLEYFESLTKLFFP